MTQLYVMTYLPNLERLMMLPDTACEMQPLYVMEYVPSLGLVTLPDTACVMQPLYVVEYVPSLERLVSLAPLW